MSVKRRELPKISVEPAFEPFSKAAGAPQVVWTRLVADLETPVSAYPEVVARARQQRAAGIGGGWRQPRPLLDSGLDPDIIWRASGDRAEINRNPGSGQFVAEPVWHARVVARADRRITDRVAGRPATDGGRHRRLYDLRHDAAGRAPAGGKTRSARCARRDHDPPDDHGDLRHREGRNDCRHRGVPAQGGTGPRGL